MGNRTDWKALHAQKVLRVDQLEAEAEELRAQVAKQGFQLEELESRIEDAKKAIERARIEGMHEATGLILRSEQP
jgi:multidrug resistance efflux pump